MRSVVTKSRLSSWSESSLSNVSFVKSPKISSPTSVSNLLPSVLSKSPLRLTSSPSSKIPTCAPSTPSVSPSNLRISNSPVVSVVSVVKFWFSFWLLDVFSLKRVGPKVDWQWRWIGVDDNALGVSYKGFTAWSSISFYGGSCVLTGCTLFSQRWCAELMITDNNHDWLSIFQTYILSSSWLPVNTWCDS